MSTNKIDLIRQALSASESSIKLARQLLSELESGGKKDQPKAKEMPGITGIFEGETMTTEKGEKYPVPENYASKSILVVGDTLKLVDSGGQKRFKQVEHVKRHKTTGIITKKEGKWTAVTSEGSYKILPAAVEHFKGDVGDEVLVQLPANNLQTPWAAVEKVTKRDEGAQEKKPEPKPKESNQSVPNQIIAVEPTKEEKVVTPKPAKEKVVLVKKEVKPKVVSKPVDKKVPVFTPTAPVEKKRTTSTAKTLADDELT